MKDLPVDGVSLRSGSVAFVKERLKSLSPLKTDSITKSAAALTTMPSAAIMVMMLTAVLLLRLMVYRLAM